MLACGSTAVSEIGRTAGGGVCPSPGCKRCSRGERFAPRGRTITLSIGNNMVEPRGGTIARACADLEDILSIRLQIYHASASAVRMQWRAGAVITAVIPERMPLRPNESGSAGIGARQPVADENLVAAGLIGWIEVEAHTVESRNGNSAGRKRRVHTGSV